MKPTMLKDTGILIVEDDAALARTLIQGLERNAYTVGTESTAEGAVRRARDDNPRLVLLDVRLPDESGFEVCRGTVRSSLPPRGPDSPDGPRCGRRREEASG